MTAEWHVYKGLLKEFFFFFFNELWLSHSVICSLPLIVYRLQWLEPILAALTVRWGTPWTPASCLALLPHSKKLVGSITGSVDYGLCVACGDCMSLSLSLMHSPIECLKTHIKEMLYKTCSIITDQNKWPTYCNSSHTKCQIFSKTLIYVIIINIIKIPKPHGGSSHAENLLLSALFSITTR